MKDPDRQERAWMSSRAGLNRGVTGMDWVLLCSGLTLQSVGACVSSQPPFLCTSPTWSTDQNVLSHRVCLGTHKYVFTYFRSRREKWI